MHKARWIGARSLGPSRDPSRTEAHELLINVGGLFARQTLAVMVARIQGIMEATKLCGRRNYAIDCRSQGAFMHESSAGGEIVPTRCMRLLRDVSKA